jgi:hypothetical protein
MLQECRASSCAEAFFTQHVETLTNTLQRLLQLWLQSQLPTPFPTANPKRPPDNIQSVLTIADQDSAVQ